MYKNYVNNRENTHGYFRKLWLVMRLTTVILIATLMQVSAAGLAQKVTYVKTDVTLRAIFKEITRQTGYEVLYANRNLNDLKKIDVNFKNTPLSDVLDKCLSDQQVSYTIDENKGILIRKKESKSVFDRLKERLAAIDVSGKVLDETGRPVPGATVRVKNGRGSAITDAEGSFTLKGIDPGAVLVISYVGYNNKEISAAENLGNIRLEIATSKLDEVQVMAYGQTSHRLNTGNTYTVKAADIETQPVMNPLLALQGRVPGLVITQSTGFANAGVTVNIQGINSIRQGNDPLYVIDGVPYPSQLFVTAGPMGKSKSSNSRGNLSDGSPSSGSGNPLSFIDPLSIESIDVLKDADATSIYGSRAANGAILITTKKGKIGQTKVDLNIQSGIGQVGHKMQLMNTQQYLAMRRQAYINDGLPIPTRATSPTSYDYDLTVYDQERYTDWQKVLIGGKAHYDNLQASVSGGTVNTQFIVGAGYHRETTVFPTDFNDRKGSLNFSINNISGNQKFRIQLTGNYQLDDNRLPQVDFTSSALSMAPNAPALYKADGSLNWDTQPNGVSASQNPLSILNQTYRNLTNNLVANMQLSYQVLPGLDLKSSFGFNNLGSNERIINPLTMYSPEFRANNSPVTGFSNSNQNTWLIEPQINYKRVIWKGTLDAMIGGTVQQNKSTNLQIYGSGYSSDLLSGNLASVPSGGIFGAQSYLILYKYTAQFARINYNLQDKYILSLNARRDGSSHFGLENRFHTFASAAGAWIFSNESFIKNNLSFLSFGKLRGSYGSTGSDQIGDYKYLNQYQSVGTLGGSYQGASGLAPTSLNNSHLAWELTKKIATGIDLGFFKDRILLNTGYFRNRSSNQLLPYNLPLITGKPNISSNFPATVQNAGWEFAVNTINIQTKNFRWSSTFNLTLTRNKLVAFPNLATTSYANVLIVGQPITITKFYNSLGVDPTTGLYVLRGADGKGTISPNGLTDKTVLIDASPNKHGGFQNSIDYRGFHLDFMLQFARQKAANPSLGYGPPGVFINLSNVGGGASIYGNQPVSIARAWQKPGDDVRIQRVSNGFYPFTEPGLDAVTAFNNTGESDLAWVDGSYIRLKNVSISWQFPENWSNKAGMRSTGVFIQGQNLLTMTNYKGLDPETPSGVGGATLPPLRVITLGIKAGF